MSEPARHLRALRADLRIATRPAVVVLLLGCAVLCGLLSAMTQDTSYAQLTNARAGVEQRIWLKDSCSGAPEDCRTARALSREESMRFLHDQQQLGRHVGMLQQPRGVVRQAALFMALGIGAAVIALIATVVIGAEWRRRTMTYALTAGFTPRAVALRRWVAVALLACVAFGFALLGAAGAAVWGGATSPLPAGDQVPLLTPLVGAVSIGAVYTLLATLTAWVTRDPLRAPFFVLAAIGGVAATTPMGPGSPGACVAAALGLRRVAELEVGDVWIWPALRFGDAGGAVHVVAGPPSGAAVLALLIAAALLAMAFARVVARQPTMP